MSTAPAISMIESAVQAPLSVLKAIAHDVRVSKAVRDPLRQVSLLTYLPVSARGKPQGCAADVEDLLGLRKAGPLFDDCVLHDVRLCRCGMDFSLFLTDYEVLTTEYNLLIKNGEANATRRTNGVCARP